MISITTKQKRYTCELHKIIVDLMCGIKVKRLEKVVKH
jgi:hypothetical protein